MKNSPKTPTTYVVVFVSWRSATAFWSLTIFSWLSSIICATALLWRRNKQSVMIGKMMMTKAEGMKRADIAERKTVWLRILNCFRHPMVTDENHTGEQTTTARRLVIKTLYRTQLRTARYRSMVMTRRFPTVPRKHIVRGISVYVVTISKICELTSHTFLFIKFLILTAAFNSATVAPHRKSLKAKLQTISNPGRRDLMPLLNKPMMTIALDTEHQMLSNIVRRENQLA